MAVGARPKRPAGEGRAGHGSHSEACLLLVPSCPMYNSHAEQRRPPTSALACHEGESGGQHKDLVGGAAKVVRAHDHAAAAGPGGGNLQRHKNGGHRCPAISIAVRTSAGALLIPKACPSHSSRPRPPESWGPPACFTTSKSCHQAKATRFAAHMALRESGPAEGEARGLHDGNRTVQQDQEASGSPPGGGLRGAD